MHRSIEEMSVRQRQPGVNTE